MDADTPPSAGLTVVAGTSYARRAEALLADRAELFAGRPAAAARTSGVVIAPRYGESVRERPGSRQLSLPLPRERGRRRARMLR